MTMMNEKKDMPHQLKDGDEDQKSWVQFEDENSPTNKVQSEEPLSTVGIHKNGDPLARNNNGRPNPSPSKSSHPTLMTTVNLNDEDDPVVVVIDDNVTTSTQDAVDNGMDGMDGTSSPASPLENNSSPQSQIGQQQVVHHSGRTHAQQNDAAFDNGEVIVTLLPVNEKLPWIIPAKFRPELVPEELMSPALTLTVEEFCQTMDKMTRDIRFILYTMLYKRILIIWIVSGFFILMTLLFTGFQGVELFAAGVIWLIINASAIFFCMYIKLQLSNQLERCMSSVNKGLLKHNIILGVDDRGKLSCHKVNLCFIYLNSTKCIAKLKSLLDKDKISSCKRDEQNNASKGGGEDDFEKFDRVLREEEILDWDNPTATVIGAGQQRTPSNQNKAERVYLHYIQRWAKEYLRRRLDWVVEDSYGLVESNYTSNTNPRHLKTSLCPCQFIEDHLRQKRRKESLKPSTCNPCFWCD